MLLPIALQSSIAYHSGCKTIPKHSADRSRRHVSIGNIGLKGTVDIDNPEHAPQPIKEQYLLAGSLESTNASLQCNPYGANNDFDPNSCHVLPALVRTFHEAKKPGRDNVVVWAGIPHS